MENNTKYEEALRDIADLLKNERETINKFNSEIAKCEANINDLQKKAKETIDDELRRNGYLGRRFYRKGNEYVIVGCRLSPYWSGRRFDLFVSKIKKDGTPSLIRETLFDWTIERVGQFLEGEI